MIAQADLQYLNGVDVYGIDGEKIGSAGQVYLDDRTDEPEWISVRTGMSDTTESFVPLDEATLTDDRLEVPFGKDRVRGAPRIHAGGDLNPAGEDELHAYYGPGSGDADRARTRSGQPLVAGAGTERSGTGHLRRYVVTEQHSMTAPVGHEGEGNAGEDERPGSR